ncbi:MerR family transcriptional regulator [Streptomyces sp. NPDC091281]|uniref:MerR family transcriptional regulator n=1 Tax=Streptomyces sp. NPDC091281 TaxID=3365985 RepID=UPI0037F61FD6
MPDRPPDLLDIGELAARTGVAPSALRYYERLGLLTPYGRDGLRRTYRPEALDRVALILGARATGFSLAEVAAVLAAGRAEVRDLLAAQCADLDTRIAALTAARTRLAHALTCRAPSLLDCPTFREAVREGLPGGGGGGGTGRRGG